MEWLASLAAGAVGGNVVGALLKKLSLGVLGNSLAGVAGGGLGTWLSGLLGGLGSLTGLAGNAVSGGLGGGVVMAVVAMIKKAMGGGK